MTRTPDELPDDIREELETERERPDLSARHHAVLSARIRSALQDAAAPGGKPSLAVVAEAHSRARPRAPRGWTARRSWLAASMLAAALLAFVLWRSARVHELTPMGADRPLTLHLRSERAGELDALPVDAKLASGDRLVLAYSAALRGWLTLVYLEERGAPTWLYPSEDQVSAPVTSGARQLASSVAVLTEPHGCEWVVAVFRQSPPTRAEVERACAELLARRHGCTLEVPPSSRASLVVRAVPR